MAVENTFFIILKISLLLFLCPKGLWKSCCTGSGDNLYYGLPAELVFFAEIFFFPYVGLSKNQSK